MCIRDRAMDDSNKDDHAKTLPKEHDRDAAIDDARKAPEELEDEGGGFQDCQYDSRNQTDDLKIRHHIQCPDEQTETYG